VIETIAFLSTSSQCIPVFNALLKEIAPLLPVRHIVDESLLAEVRRAGAVTPELRRRVAAQVAGAAAEGARVVVCACPAIGACVEEVGVGENLATMRIDRPMVEKAVQLGARILIAATRESALAPARELISAVARDRGARIETAELLCDSAWAHLEAGDGVAYVQAIADRLQATPLEVDVVILAQVSMAAATELCEEIAVPVLSSPRLGTLAAVRAFRAVGAGRS
jgi:hypothetical protein